MVGKGGDKGNSGLLRDVGPYPTDADFEERVAWVTKYLQNVDLKDCILLAARSALRVLPLLRMALPSINESASTHLENSILPLFRCYFLSIGACIATSDDEIAFFKAIELAHDDALGAADIIEVAYVASEATINSAYAAIGALQAAQSYKDSNKLGDTNAISFAIANSIDASFKAGSLAFSPTATQFTSLRTMKKAIAAFESDLNFLNQTSHLHRRIALASRPLWLDQGPSEITSLWFGLQAIFRKANDDWDIWSDWYFDVLSGARGDQFLFGLNTGQALELWSKVALIDNSIWQEGPTVLNAEFKYLVEKEKKKSSTLSTNFNQVDPSPSEIAEIASPQPFINDAGQLDAKPNAEFNRVIAAEVLKALPRRQKALAETLISSLPRQAPRTIISALNSYTSELSEKHPSPDIVLLDDMVAILNADFKAPDAHEWLVAGLNEAAQRFNEAHWILKEHYPLSGFRDKIIDNIKIKETDIPIRPLQEMIKQLLAQAELLRNEGKVTEKFVAAIRIHASNLDAVLSKGPDLIVDPNDRWQRPSYSSVAKTRVIVNIGGFVKKTLDDLPSKTAAELIKVSLAGSLHKIWDIIVNLIF